MILTFNNFVRAVQLQVVNYYDSFYKTMEILRKNNNILNTSTFC